jgi:hypothetical protein
MEPSKAFKEKVIEIKIIELKALIELTYGKDPSTGRKWAPTQIMNLDSAIEFYFKMKDKPELK